MAKFVEDKATKKAHSLSDYTDEQNFDELMECFDDPLFFMKTFMKIQHPLRGSLKFEPYPFQEKIVRGFYKYKNVIAMTGRQMGKCISFFSLIMVNGEQRKIGELLTYTFRERIVNYLENILLKLAM